MNIEILGKKVLGQNGFCLSKEKMKDGIFEEQLEKIISYAEDIYGFDPTLVMPAITNIEEVELQSGKYVPQIYEIDSYDSYDKPILVDPQTIFNYCKKDKDDIRPNIDFIMWNSVEEFFGITFSREAPILAFESADGAKRALGTILRPSLVAYGDYLFKKMKKYLGEKTTVNLVTCNHYGKTIMEKRMAQLTNPNYDGRSLIDIISDLAEKYDFPLIIGKDTETDEDLFHRGESGNHVVMVW